MVERPPAMGSQRVSCPSDTSALSMCRREAQTRLRRGTAVAPGKSLTYGTWSMGGNSDYGSPGHKRDDQRHHDQCVERTAVEGKSLRYGTWVATVTRVCRSLLHQHGKKGIMICLNRSPTCLFNTCLFGILFDFVIWCTTSVFVMLLSN